MNQIGRISRASHFLRYKSQKSATLSCLLQRNFAQKVENEEVSNKPINFFGSQAATWRAQQSRSGGAEELEVWYQPYVISASVAIFLIYFCILREENDVDEKLGKSLFDHIEGLEETQLVVTYKYNKEHGIDVVDVEKRLKELGIDITKL